MTEIIIPSHTITEDMLQPHILRKLKRISTSVESIQQTVNEIELPSIELAEAINYGEAISFADVSGTIKAYKSGLTLPANALAYETGEVGDSIKYMTNNEMSVKDGDFVIGETVVLITGTPNISTTLPTYTSGDNYQKIGTAVDTDKISINIEEPEELQ